MELLVCWDVLGWGVEYPTQFCQNNSKDLKVSLKISKTKNKSQYGKWKSLQWYLHWFLCLLFVVPVPITLCRAYYILPTVSHSTALIKHLIFFIFGVCFICYCWAEFPFPAAEWETNRAIRDLLFFKFYTAYFVIWCCYCPCCNMKIHTTAVKFANYLFILLFESTAAKHRLLETKSICIVWLYFC